MCAANPVIPRILDIQACNEVARCYSLGKGEDRFSLGLSIVAPSPPEPPVLLAPRSGAQAVFETLEV